MLFGGGRSRDKRLRGPGVACGGATCAHDCVRLPAVEDHVRGEFLYSLVGPRARFMRPLGFDRRLRAIVLMDYHTRRVQPRVSRVPVFLPERLSGGLVF